MNKRQHDPPAHRQRIHHHIEFRDGQEAKKRLRIGVTEACNLRCFFCHGDGGAVRHFRHPESRLTPDDLQLLGMAASQARFTKVKLTGGEPMLYRHGEKDIFSAVRALSIGCENLELSLVTNGIALDRESAKRLKSAGLRRISVSLHAGTPKTFDRYAHPQSSDTFESVVRGIEAAVDADLTPVKINSVIYHSQTDPHLSNIEEIPDILRIARNSGSPKCASSSSFATFASQGKPMLIHTSIGIRRSLTPSTPPLSWTRFGRFCLTLA